jgi:Ca2+-binding EF-hand superfamily protein
VAVLEKLTAINQSGKADLPQEFRVLDLRREGFVPISQFQTLLLGLGVRQADVEVLTDFYSPKPRLVNYFGILRDQELFAPPVLGVNEPLRPEAKAVLARLKAAVHEKRLNVARAFGKYDSGQTGQIDGGRVRPVFDEIGFRISPGDEDVLKRAFGNGKFDYERLLGILAEEEEQEQSSVGPVPLDAATLIILEDVHARVHSRRRRVRDAFVG